ncbi:MAG: hypothetical protein OXH92_09260 [Bryobacterales bacterium]|nr:hypothetical protein [Bryobacterales bacterium]MDE0434183.1 hypothetical protein [Bryobacterales bacterium]
MRKANNFDGMDELLYQRQEQHQRLVQSFRDTRAEFRHTRVWICWMVFGFVIYYLALQLVSTPRQILALLSAFLLWIALLFATSIYGPRRDR